MNFGLVGSILLGICSVPELIRTVQDGTCHVGWGMLLIWLLGELLTFIHVFKKHKDMYLLMNYSLNIIIVSVMVVYKIGA